MPCLWDLFFIFIIIFTVINHIFIMIIIHNDFQRFGGSKFLNGCFISLTNACEECNNFQDSRQMFMISYFKVSQKSFWDSWILVYCQFKNYFTFITKKKLYFPLTYSFYCCLVKNGSKKLPSNLCISVKAYIN